MAIIATYKAHGTQNTNEQVLTVDELFPLGDLAKSVFLVYKGDCEEVVYQTHVLPDALSFANEETYRILNGG